MSLKPEGTSGWVAPPLSGAAVTTRAHERPGLAALINREAEQWLQLLRYLNDIFWVGFGLHAAYWLRFESGWLPVFYGIPTREHYLQILGYMILVWISSLKFIGAYRTSTLVSRVDESLAVLLGSGLALLITLALLFFYRSYSYSRMVVALMWSIGTLAILVSRWGLATLARWLRHRGFGQRRVLILGNAAQQAKWREELRAYREMGHRFVEEVVDPQESMDQVREVLDRQQVQEVIAPGMGQFSDGLWELIDTCRERRIQLHLVPDTRGIIAAHFVLKDTCGVPLFSVEEVALRRWYNRVLKRLFDLLCLVLLALPAVLVMGLIALLVKLSSRGPVFFRQERVSLDGRHFIIAKFRTMYRDAEDRTGPVWATPGDDRCTPLGRWLRRTSLDELPQLWNVLIGEMSLVGPRPERPFFTEKFGMVIPRYDERHLAKPGMTGWAQANGWRGATSVEERTKFDIYYVENWSLLLDVKILFMTIVEVFRMRNAY